MAILVVWRCSVAHESGMSLAYGPGCKSLPEDV